ncbi:putative membrane protein, partial [Vibrio harveyi]
PTTQQ